MPGGRTLLTLSLLSAACAGPAPRPAAGEVATGAVPGAVAGAPGEASLAAGDAAWAGDRPTPITRPLEGYVGRQIWIAAAGGVPERWSLRAIGADHVTVERTRTYRVLPVRRIAEITWTDLAGIDPTPRIVLGPE